MSVRFHAKLPLSALLALPAALLLLLSGGNLLRAQQTLLLSTPNTFGSDAASGSLAGTAPSGPDAEFHSAPHGFARGRGTADCAPLSANHWDRLVQDLIRDGFQMGMRSANLSQGSVGGTGMNSGGECSSGAGMNGGQRSTGGGFGQQSGGRPGGNSGSLLGMASGLSRDLGAGSNGALGTALNVLPTLDRLSLGGMNFPINSSLGNFRFSYQTPFSGGGMGGWSGIGSPSASFTTNSPSGKVDFSMAARLSGGMSGGQMGGSTGMRAGLPSFGSQSGGTSSFSLQTGDGSGGSGSSGGSGFSLGRPGGRPGGALVGGGQGKPGPGGGKGGGKGPSASVSLQLKF